jgi:MYXO-CTERM domain-containing protein
VALGDPASATITVSNSADSERSGVALAVTAAGGVITSLEPSVGDCTTSTCNLGTMAPNASVTVEVTGTPSGVGTYEVTAMLTSALGCEIEPTNDTASAAVTVEGGEGGAGGGGVTPVAPVAAEGGSCGCRTRSTQGHSPWAAVGSLVALALLHRRRARRQRA